MSNQLQMFEEGSYQESTLSLSEVLAKILVWLEREKEWMAQDQVLLPKQLGLSKNADQVFLSGKMLKELSPQTLAQTFGQLSKPLQTLGVIDSNGNCLIQSGFYPKIERESTLSDVLEKEVENKYFLSQKTIDRLMKQEPTQTPVRLQQDTKHQQVKEVTLLNVTKFHKK